MKRAGASLPSRRCERTGAFADGGFIPPVLKSAPMQMWSLYEGFFSTSNNNCIATRSSIANTAKRNREGDSAGNRSIF